MLSTLTAPKFCKGEEVLFLGGSGVVKNHQSESGSWMYTIEMHMGPEPDVGRIGYETTVIMPEVDLTASNVDMVLGSAAA